jgi:hypothetical protein
MVLNRGDTPLIAAGWVHEGVTASSPAFLTFVFSMALTVTGAALSASRAATGFLIFGAGYLAGAISVGVLFSDSPTWPMACAAVGVPGAWYSRLGFRQQTADRS